MQHENTELTDAIPGTGTNIRERDPELFGDKPAASKLEQFTADELAAISGDDADDDAPPRPGEAVPDRDDSGRFVPRERIGELTAQRNKERERAEAAEARAAQMEQERQEREEAERAAAEAKALQVHDYDADRAALDAKYEALDILEPEYRKELRNIDKAEREQDRRIAEENAVARLRKEQQVERDAAASRRAEEAETGAQTAAEAFLAKPENAAYRTDRFRIAALNAEREAIYLERKGNITWDELLEEGKKRVEAYIAEKKPAAAAATETDAQRVARERREAQAKTTATVSSLPSRPDGGVGARATTEPEDGNDISPEQFRALPKSERDKRLGRTA